MKVELIAHSQVKKGLDIERLKDEYSVCDGQIISLAAIRQCYSYKTALEVLDTESEKYFGEKGKEGNRLFNQIVRSGHVSTVEHTTFTFAVEGVSRALLAQLTRHRQLSFSVQSQRYNKFSSDSRSGGFDYVVPETVNKNRKSEYKKLNDNYIWVNRDVKEIYDEHMAAVQRVYDALIESGVPQEDARSVLPNAATCNLVTSGNLRAWLEFYKKRKKGEGAQHEITVFAELIKNAIIEVEPWTAEYFELGGK